MNARAAGLLILREEASVQAAVEALAETVWDHRFRLIADRMPPAGGMIGALAEDAARFRGMSDLPAVGFADASGVKDWQSSGGGAASGVRWPGTQLEDDGDLSALPDRRLAPFPPDRCVLAGRNGAPSAFWGGSGC